MKSLIICSSIHHQNTLKVANAMAEVLNCSVIQTGNVKIEDLEEYDLIGFGSGIYGWRPHQLLLKLVDNLSDMSGKKAFIFSTSGGKEHNIEKWHRLLREKLIKKGFTILDEFNCIGWDSFGPLKLFGGMNKGRPNEDDLEKAKVFIKNIIDNVNN